ncbi:tetratricopeptide repeat protein [Paenibacillus sp. GYB003]|uniref:tetratricopeptide repeat protein n=1 Tax=Paenibacillus sp. GYB003 TaxID=2994392 RepID=UPI002F9672EE
MDGENEIKQAYASLLDADFEKAIEWFEQAVRVDPANADFHYKLSMTYARSNKLDKAIEHAIRASELRPDHEAYRYHAATLRARALMLEAGKRMEAGEPLRSALNLLTEAVKLDPLLTEAHLLLAVTYGELERYEPALAAANDALKLDPHNAEAIRLAGEFDRKLNRYSRH